MKTLHVIVSNKVATYLQRDGYIVCGNADNQIEFTFDKEWDAYERKTARFIWGGKPVDVEFSGNVCPVPIVANTEQLKVGVYVENLSTTTSAVIPCRLSVLCDSKTEAEGKVVIPDGTPVLGEATITENGEHYPGEGYDGFYKVTVKVAEGGEIPEGYIKPTGTKAITENGTHDVAKYASVAVNVPTGSGEEPVLQEKTVTPAEVKQTVTPGSGYDGLSKVTVEAIPSEYIIPSGTEEITANGTFDVKDKASVKVAVESGGAAIETGTLTIVGGFENEFDIVYSTYSNGSITSVHEYIDGMGTGDAIFTGILLGTPIVLYTPRGEYLDDGDIQGVTEVSFTENTNCGVYKLTASNATASFL